MPAWSWVLLAFLLALLLAGVAILIWVRRSGFTPAEGAAELRAIGVDLVRLPGRLWSLARDPRVSRSERWMLLALAIYILSPIDPIPDVLPGIGHLDELILVPFVLRAIRRRIPDEVWNEHLPPRQPIGEKTRAERSGSAMSWSSGNTGRRTMR